MCNPPILFALVPLVTFFVLGVLHYSHPWKLGLVSSDLAPGPAYATRLYVPTRSVYVPMRSKSVDLLLCKFPARFVYAECTD